jgi:hypothetical protein
LHDAEKERRLALEAQLAELTPDAQLARDLKKRKQEAVEAAKADTSLPAYIKRAIEAARDPISAAEILDEFRASQTQPASKQPAPPAPSLAGAPPSPAQPKKLEQMTEAEIYSTPVAELQKLLGKANSAPMDRGPIFGRFFAK